MGTIPPSPNPNPFATLSDAVVSIAECFADNAAIAAYIRRIKCDDPSWSDMVALTSLAIAAALCQAANDNPSCCEADPFVVETLEVAIDAQINDLTVKGPGSIDQDVIIGGTICGPKVFKRSLLPLDKLVSIDAPGIPAPCFFLFPQSDLALGPDLVVDYLTVGTSCIIEGDLDILEHLSRLDGSMNVAGDMLTDGMCPTLAETDFTADAQMVISRAVPGTLSCLEVLPIGICC